MEEAPRVTSRRSMLGRGALLVAGAFGVGATVKRAGAGDAAAIPAPASPQVAPPTELRLFARHYHLHSPTHRAGQIPAKGERTSAYGELLDRPKGKVVGHFTAAHLTLDSPFAAGLGSLEIHTFHLGDGTLHGLGAAAPGAEGQFVILGGTGRFADARGGYVAVQRHREAGGNGTADFHLKLAT
jgi:hypothetical protein